MNLIDRAKETHRQEQEKRKNRPSSGKISPSSFGWCYRRQWYKAHGQEVTDPASFQSWCKMRLGKLIHDEFQSMYPKECCEVKVETNDCFGYADIVQDDRVIDIKSQSDWAFKYHAKKGYDIALEKVDNWLQVAFYAMILGKETIELDFINQKQTSDIVEYEEKTIKWIPKVEVEIRNIKEKIKGEIPPKEPRLYGGKECKWSTGSCQYYTICGGKIATTNQPAN